MSKTDHKPLTAEERAAHRSVTRATPQPASIRCDACGTAQNPMTGECRGCSD